MQKSFPQDQQGASDDFKPNSFIIFCLDEAGNVGFEASWGNSISDVKKFAALLSKIVDGNFTELILSQLKEQSEGVKNGNKKYDIIKNAIYKKNNIDLVISPLNVEINP